MPRSARNLPHLVERVPGLGWIIVVLLGGEPVLWRCSRAAGRWEHRAAYDAACRRVRARMLGAVA